ncbi:hypothetical protein FGO68_gene8324 [Halteria grandinella]|uniref:Uncharacterized protein n=1 Tax=Halteria grandinella TaxID=5974 RepID=A0A8J8NVJ2_HALGN|nr:hypothetical protein FGO68_gene8324 [Halteria grandinella]
MNLKILCDIPELMETMFKYYTDLNIVLLACEDNPFMTQSLKLVNFSNILNLSLMLFDQSLDPMEVLQHLPNIQSLKIFIRQKYATRGTHDDNQNFAQKWKDLYGGQKRASGLRVLQIEDNIMYRYRYYQALIGHYAQSLEKVEIMVLDYQLIQDCLYHTQSKKLNIMLKDEKGGEQQAKFSKGLKEQVGNYQSIGQMISSLAGSYQMRDFRLEVPDYLNAETRVKDCDYLNVIATWKRLEYLSLRIPPSTVEDDNSLKEFMQLQELNDLSQRVLFTFNCLKYLEMPTKRITAMQEEHPSLLELRLLYVTLSVKDIRGIVCSKREGFRIEANVRVHEEDGDCEADVLKMVKTMSQYVFNLHY